LERGLFKKYTILKNSTLDRCRVQI
jgi:hypothetical protein